MSCDDTSSTRFCGQGLRTNRVARGKSVGNASACDALPTDRVELLARTVILVAGMAIPEQEAMASLTAAIVVRSLVAARAGKRLWLATVLEACRGQSATEVTVEPSATTGRNQGAKIAGRAGVGVGNLSTVKARETKSVLNPLLIDRHTLVEVSLAFLCSAFLEIALPSSRFGIDLKKP